MIKKDSGGNMPPDNRFIVVDVNVSPSNHKGKEIFYAK